MEDVTRRLRMSHDPKDVERERKLAQSLFYSAMSDLGGKASHESVRRNARQSIEASCIFWEEWDIAVLTPEIQEETGAKAS